MPDPSTLCEALVRAASFPGTGLRILDREGHAGFHAWAEVEAGARRVASGVIAAGQSPGACTALVFPTGIAFFEAFFGVLLAGGVPVPLYPPVRLGRMAEYHTRTGAMLKAVRADLVLAEPRIRRLLGETVAAAAPRVPRCLSPEDLPEGSPGRPDRPVAAEDLGLVQFSSGTTGVPRPVALTHRALLAQAAILESFLVDRPGAIHAGVSWLPLYHDMGLVGCVFPALTRPGVLTLLGPEVFVARPATWLRAISRYGGTVSPAPAFAYALAADRVRDEELDGVDLSRWRLALCGAEPIGPAVLRRFGERFRRWGFDPGALKPVYGLAEAALAVTFTPPDRPMSTVRLDRAALARDEVRPDPDGVELARLGPPVPGFAVRVTDAEGHDLPPDRIGRIRIRGPSLLAGYLHLPRETAEVLRDGWLDTGDRGFLDRGELVVTGRDKEILVLKGRKYPPALVEQALDGLPGLRAGCAAAVSHRPEAADAERLLLLAETSRDAADTDVAALPDACARAILAGTGLLVDEVVLLAPGTLPRTSSGKIRRREALAAHLAGTLSPPDRVTPLSVAGWYVRSAWAFTRGPRPGRGS